MATIADVAAGAGVSKATVSRVFSRPEAVRPATRERVLAAAAELGYAGPDPLAASLRRGRSGVIGVFIGERLLYAFRDPVSVQLLDGITEVLGAHGAGLLLLAGDSGRPPLEQILRCVLGFHRARAAILVPDERGLKATADFRATQPRAS